MDWNQTSRKRLTRRRFLSAASALATAGALAACDSPSSSTPGSVTPPPLPTRTATRPAATSTLAPSATAAPGTPQQGGVLRTAGAILDVSQYDPHRTWEDRLIGIQSLVFSRLLTYASQVEGLVEADLAEALPEQPDAATYVFRIREGATWQDGDLLGGRPVTAEDVRFAFERQINGDASFRWKARWSVIDRIETPSEREVRVILKEPRANMVAMFAEPASLIVPLELAEAGFAPSNMAGSGPFRWDSWNPGDRATVGRNARWGQGPLPYLEGLDIVHPAHADEVEALLRTKQLDAAVVSRPVANRLAERLPQLRQLNEGSTVFFGTWFSTPQVPYNDPRLRSAIAMAVDRQEMIDRFFAGSGDINPWVSWPLRRWTLPHAELTALPGYRPGTTGRQADLAEARALIAAVLAEKTLPDPLPLFVFEETEEVLTAARGIGLGALIQAQVQAALGITVGVYPMSAGEIEERTRTGEAPWLAAHDTGPLDLDDWLYPYFHSAGTLNRAALRDAELDALIVAQRTEFDADARREKGFDAQRRLLALNPGVNFVSERTVALTWPYVRNFPLDAMEGYQQRFARCWLDPSDPTYAGRQG